MTTITKLRLADGIRMKILRIHEHFPARSAEWGLAYIMATVGATTLSIQTNFESILLLYGDQPLTRAWAYLALVTGLLRLIALYINGSSRHTPKARMVCAGVSAMVWIHLAALFMAATEKLGVFPIVLAVIPWFIIGDIYASYSAGKDARVAAEIKKALQDGHGASSDSPSSGAS